MSMLNEFKGFWGTGPELAERAKVLSKALGVKSEKITERLIRYYATEGVLDKPDRLGREAAYHFRHLLQLMVARRLVDEGVTLVAVKKFNLDKSTEELEQALLKPSKEEAIAVSEQYREAVLEAKEAKQVAMPVSVQEDVIGEVKQIREGISKELKEIEYTKHQIQDMLNKLEDRQQELYKRLEYEREELRHMTMSSIERLTQMVEQRNWQLEEQFQVFRKEMSSIQEQMMTVLTKQFEQRLLSK